MYINKYIFKYAFIHNYLYITYYYLNYLNIIIYISFNIYTFRTFVALN